MHFWQAIKMASKSLWTNKLRSFLTMLGIIIGVVTVSLLVTVAQGVSDAVVSSIRTQSTLSIIMNTSGKMTYSGLSAVLKSEQPEESAEDYFEYSLVYSSSAVVASDLTDFNPDYEDIAKDYIISYEKLYAFTEDELKNMTEEERQLAQILMSRKKARPVSSSIYAVDKNFNDVYKLDIDGKFPTENNEILVDKEFIDTYLGGKSNEEVKGSKVSFGVQYYTQIKISFKNEMTSENLQRICDYLLGNYEIIQGSGDKTGLNLTIIENEDGSYYTYDLENNTMTVNVEFFQYLSNENLILAINAIPEISSNVIQEEPIIVEDIYDATNAKTYTVVGVLNENNSMFGGNSSRTFNETSGEGTSLIDFMFSSSSGTCYMLLDESNLAPLGSDSKRVTDISVTYAYLRYKTEDVMSSSANRIMLALIGANYGYMTDFFIISMSSVANIINDVMDILTTMLTVISIVSLIVGGIGIMNIMLVAVTERTREIGIRKAIGAKRSSILVQFLVEALMLSLIGGAIGLGISAIGVAIISHYIGFAMSMPLWVIAMSLGFCTLIGLVFGMFPAVKASRMQPIDALRRE